MNDRIFECPECGKAHRNSEDGDARCFECFALINGLDLRGGKEKVDPKKGEGDKKTPLQLLPPVFKKQVALVLRLGGEKYGFWNWRKSKVECQTYVGAIHRHLDAWQSGEDLDPESGQSHLAHVAASIAIMMDAEEQETMEDNRPHKI